MITVIGLGFVGLTTALGFAHKGFKVFGYDIDRKKVNDIKKGEIPFHEPYLYEYLRTYADDNFCLCDTLESALRDSEVIFYCVGTPVGPNGEANVDIIKTAVRDSLKFIKKDKFKVITIKSTVPPSTAKNVIAECIKQEGFVLGKQIGIVSNPEFLREGYAWEDFLKPDRIVIGEYDKKSGDVLQEIYKSFGGKTYRVSLNTAEFMKYLSNSFLANLISFSNEMSMIADKFGDIDVINAFASLHDDKRWFGNPAAMTSYAYPGCGFGGYCLPKDVLAIKSAANDKGCETAMLDSVLNTNNHVKEFIVQKVVNASKADEKIGIAGLSFKPESDDIRDTPAKQIIELLIKNDRRNIIAYDPMAVEIFKNTYKLPIDYADSFEELSKSCSVILIATAWPEFKQKKDLLAGKKIIDGRYFLNK
ncbi:MAG: nucleotide sugar dehydrogenase [bacterium]